MPEVKVYQLPPTKLIPNSPYPVLHYPRFFDIESHPTKSAAGEVHDTFAKNGWDTQWIFRYGPSQRSHYHPQAHECMAVLSGSATIRFGVADTDPDLQLNTNGPAREPGGIEVAAAPGDVFIIPAGVAHKTHDAVPVTPVKLLTPGSAHGIEAAIVRDTLQNVELSGFTMIGAYPRGDTWGSAEGGEHVGNFEKVWSVPKPPNDPVMGSDGGLNTLWKKE